MSVETLTPSRTETSNIDPELAGRLLEAAFAKGVDYHKQRIMLAFGGGQKLPELPKGDMAETLETSEKRYRKASDLLYREEPMEIPDPENGITKELILSLADNLAWKGIDVSISKDHLDRVDLSRTQLISNLGAHSDQLVLLRKEQRALKGRVLEDKHLYRDFFDSTLAEKLRVNSPAYIRKFLRSSSLTNIDSNSIERGISLEVSARQLIDSILGNGTGSERAVKYGNTQEDTEGGDIVVVDGNKILYIDLKSSQPDGLRDDEIERGYRFYADKEKQIYKAMVWAESREPVAEDSFRLTDPRLQHSIQNVLSEIR